MDSCFISICKLGSVKNPFATITIWTLFWIQKIYSVGRNKIVIFMNFGSSTSSWTPWRWVRLDLILMMRNIYINSNLNSVIKFTSSSRSTLFKYMLPWNISQIITKTIPVSMSWMLNAPFFLLKLRLGKA